MNHSKTPISSSSFFLIVFFCIAILLLLFLVPPKHNPDANIYYLVTIRLLRGEWWRAVDGMNSPLFSWLLVLPAAFGVPLDTGSRLINSVSFLVVLFELRAIGRMLLFSETEITQALFIVGVHLSYFAITLVTSDMLAAAVTMIFIRSSLDRFFLSSKVSFVKVGILGALSYYAKAYQYLIVIGASCVSWSCLRPRVRTRTALATLSFAILLVVPWIVLLSQKYKTPTFSLQQFIAVGALPLEYSPHNLPQLSPPPSAGIKAERSVQSVLPSFGKHFVYSVKSLWGYIGNNLFSSEGLIIFVAGSLLGVYSALKSKPARPAILSILLFIFFQFGLYLILWGPYFRYYFSVMPFIYLFFARGLSQIQMGNGIRRGVGISVAYLLLGLFSIQAIRSFASDWNETRSEVVTTLLKNPRINREKGAIAGNSLLDQYPGLVGARLFRESWVYLSMHLQDSPEKLATFLDREEVAQIIWSGDILPSLDKVSGFNKEGPFDADGYRYFLYTRTAQ